MAKENLKANVIEAPTLFVGVGGTGCKIVTKVAEKCLPPEKENINFVCMDTNVNDLTRVAKSKANIYYIQTSNTQTVGNYLDYDQDALKNWFPKNAVLYDKTVSEGAGQVRAISRLALNSTIKTGRLQPLYDAIDDLFRKSGREMKQAMRCVIASTASGGTGSGIILPMSMLIRDYVKTKYPNTSLIVRALIMLPEALDSVIDSNVEKESQRRNAYATIKEINAFMMKGSGFLDVDEDLERYKNLHVDVSIPGTDELKTLSLLPFDFCFLLDGQNAEDSTLVTLNQYIEQAAQALYEQNVGPMQANAFSVEDNIIKEMSNPGNLGRNRFGGIGAGVIRYPYEDVADYVAYDWAMDSIGGEGEASKWGKYDHNFKVKLADARKKGMAESDLPKIEDVYVSVLRTATDNFSKDLRNLYLQNDVGRINGFLSDMAKYMRESLSEDSELRAKKNAASPLAKEIDYADEENRGKAVENKEKLRAFESVIRRRAERTAASAAEALFLNERPTLQEDRHETIEYMLKNVYGDAAHPNAARYLLYLLKTEMKRRIDSTNSRINILKNGLEKYSPEADLEGEFDAKYSSKNKERTLDDLCEAEKSDDPSLLERIRKYGEIYNQFNEFFPDYYKKVAELGDKIAELEGYKFGHQYVDELCSMYEGFFRTFPEKVNAMAKAQDDMVDDLAFTKGDSFYNVCSTKDMLDELSRSTNAGKEESSMLDPELNALIFDAIKANVRFEREIANASVVEEDLRVDIFNDVLIGFFKEGVRRNCNDILDMNIIEAIAKEARLIASIKAREEAAIQGEKKENQPLMVKIDKDDIFRHIKRIISMGERLSAPGIQRITNEEPREVKLCAYNKSLDEMRVYRMDDFLPKGSAVDTVSKYELHFFNALYNLTPNKLKKFAAPYTTETGRKDSGLYHNAYASYARFIGPDSTKNMMISTHIDKRWDAISVMPEMDLNYMKERRMKIHQAMIYGLVHKAIKYKELSLVTHGTKVFQYENSDERKVEMIVPNGTPCDQFFEILDALYINSAIVEDMAIVIENKRINDRTQNSDYKETVFYKNLREFKIDDDNVGYKGKDRRRLTDIVSSLFEIPLAYYNSLPNRQRFMSEIGAMIDAVIEIFREELYLWERGMDAKFLLRDELRDQFKLLLYNYNNPEITNIRYVSADENPVIDLIFRKIRNVIAESPEPDDCDQTITKMREWILKGVPEEEMRSEETRAGDFAE